MLEQNKVVTERATELWNTGDLALVDEIHAADFVNHDPSLVGLRFPWRVATAWGHSLDAGGLAAHQPHPLFSVNE